MSQTPEHIIDFWFNAIDNKLWFKKDNEFDLLLTAQFSQLHTCLLYTSDAADE